MKVVQLQVEVVPDVMVDLTVSFWTILGVREPFMEQALGFLMNAGQPLGYQIGMALLASASRAMLTCWTTSMRSSAVIWPMAIMTTCCTPSRNADRPVNTGGSRACRSESGGGTYTVTNMRRRSLG